MSEFGKVNYRWRINLMDMKLNNRFMNGFTQDKRCIAYVLHGTTCVYS